VTKNSETGIAKKENPMIALETERKAELYDMSGEFEKALQNAMPVERFIRIALNEFRQKPKLWDTEKASRQLAVMQAAQAGLEIGGAFGECGLTPYGKECKLSIYFPGLLKAAMNSGRISQPSAMVVYEKEPYKFDIELGCNAPTIQLPPSKRGKDRIAAFAQYFFDGRRIAEWMWAEDVEKVRSCSQGYRAFKAGKIASTPWVGEFDDQMWKMAVLRRLLKRSPKSSQDFRLLAAIEADNADFDFDQRPPQKAFTAGSRPALREALGVTDITDAEEVQPDIARESADDFVDGIADPTPDEAAERSAKREEVDAPPQKACPQSARHGVMTIITMLDGEAKFKCLKCQHEESV